MRALRALSLLVVFLGSAEIVGTASTITTVAGGGPGSGAAAITVGLDGSGVAADNAGNFFIASGVTNQIYKVEVSGALTVVASNGLPGTGAEGVPATSTPLRNPTSVTVDGSGNVFIVEPDLTRIRRVDAMTHTISTVAGQTSLPGFSGDGGPATSARLNGPSGVTVDAARNLLIADTGNRRIRRVDAATGIITTVAGPGGAGTANGVPATQAGLEFPWGVAVDPAGNIFISEANGQRVRKVNPAGIINTVAGTGVSGFNGDGIPATSAMLATPSQITLDAAGNLFIADQNNQRIRRVDAATGIITTVAGNGSFGFSGDGGPSTSAKLASPLGLGFDSADNIFFADQNNQRIRQVSFLAGAAQLSVHALTVNPTTVHVGEAVTLSVTVQNTGTGTANNVAPQTAATSGAATLTSGPNPPTATIGAGSSAVFAFTYTAGAVGTVIFSAGATGTDAST